MNYATPGTPLFEQIDAVLQRYSIADLREQTDADLGRADRMFYKADSMQITASGEAGNIRWWQIASGKKTYEARRFKNFVWCSCLDFHFSKRMCKHLAFTAGVYCENCRQLPAKVGKLCYDCDVTAHQFLGKSWATN